MQNWKFDKLPKKPKLYFIGSEERHCVCFAVYWDPMIHYERETLAIKKMAYTYCISSNYYFDINIYKAGHFPAWIRCKSSDHSLAG